MHTNKGAITQRLILHKLPSSGIANINQCKRTNRRVAPNCRKTHQTTKQYIPCSLVREPKVLRQSMFSAPSVATRLFHQNGYLHMQTSYSILHTVWSKLPSSRCCHPPQTPLHLRRFVNSPKSSLMSEAFSHTHVRGPKHFKPVAEAKHSQRSATSRFSDCNSYKHACSCTSVSAIKHPVA